MIEEPQETNRFANVNRVPQKLYNLELMMSIKVSIRFARIRQVNYV